MHLYFSVSLAPTPKVALAGHRMGHLQILQRLFPVSFTPSVTAIRDEGHDRPTPFGDNIRHFISPFSWMCGETSCGFHSLLANGVNPLFLCQFSIHTPLQRSVCLFPDWFPGYFSVIYIRPSMASVSSFTPACVLVDSLSPTGFLWHSIRFTRAWEGLFLVPLALASQWSLFRLPAHSPLF